MVVRKISAEERLALQLRGLVDTAFASVIGTAGGLINQVVRDTERWLGSAEPGSRAEQAYLDAVRLGRDWGELELQRSMLVASLGAAADEVEGRELVVAPQLP